MSREANLHGVCVLAGETGLLILGESGSGKSALAARMIADWPFGAVRLVADDRVILSLRAGRLVARPHPAIAGRMELRGFGIVSPPAAGEAVVSCLLSLVSERPDRLPEEPVRCEDLLGVRLPRADLPQGRVAFEELITIWPYLRDTIAEGRSILVRAP